MNDAFYPRTAEDDAALVRARATYSTLMVYIEDRNTVAKWCDQLREDERAAEDGGFGEVVRELRQAHADYAALQAAKGGNGYPYNVAIGRFLGLSIKTGNNEPEHGYYMASCLKSHHAYGAARREVDRLIAARRPLKVVAARSKKTGQPLRFHVFAGPEQIKVDGYSAALTNGKARVSLSNNWSIETLSERMAEAMRTGTPFGEPVSAEATPAVA